MTKPSESRAAFTFARAMAQSKLQRDVALQQDVALPPSTAKPARPHRIRLFVVPVIVFGFTILPAAIGIEQPEPQPKTEAALDDAPVPKQQEGASIEAPSSGEPSPGQSKAAGPIGFFVLDVAKTYVALSDAKQADTQRRQRNSQK